MEDVEFTSSQSRSTKAICGKCGTHFGNFYDSWQQITGSYFLPSLPASYEVPGLVEKKIPLQASSKSDLRGCEVLPLPCRHCGERIAIRILQTPIETEHLLGCEIFKHKSIIFRNEDTGKEVQPDVVEYAAKSRPSLGATRTTATNHIETPASSKSTVPTEPSFHPPAVTDMSASTTLPPIQRQLSGDHPGSLPPLLQSKSVQLSPHAQSMQMPATNGTSYPSQFQVKMDAIDRIQTQVNYNRATLELQSRELKRVESAVGGIQHDIRSLFRLVEDLRRPGATGRKESRAGVDDSDLELFSQTLANIAAKTNEIDGIKLQMEVLKRKTKRLEENTAGPVTPSGSSQRESSVLPPLPGSAGPLASLAETRPTYPHHSLPHEKSGPQPSGWATVNPGTKRPLVNGTDAYATNHTPVGSPKRLKLAPLGPRESYPSQHQRMDADDYSLRRSSSFPEKTNSGYGINQDQAEEHWRADHYVSQRGRETPRGPGRPRKYPSVEGAESTEWERDQGRVSGAYDPSDAYYQQRRGSGVMRRGSGGALAGTTGGGLGRPMPAPTMTTTIMDPYAHTKKTRTKPSRNSEGILIRKDGRPDMRSQSSAANLRKVHARKEQERMAELGTSLPHRGSPQEGGVDSPQQPVQSIGANTPDAEGSAEVRDERESTDEGSRHEDVMRQIFSRGVERENERVSSVRKELESPVSTAPSTGTDTGATFARPTTEHGIATQSESGETDRGASVGQPSTEHGVATEGESGETTGDGTGAEKPPAGPEAEAKQ
ncbi:hypothetical protein P152DRAFT_456967 [Eremomyces bilateralis CBS 781.70]|uniref:Uncharacterized protein n=1 Tax=Eremomyces bilateralis CBS 781.70 TaxID=1392243 RepID=A0A6G1G6C4_9PEZI|nr:uncharacterized protein P152DRAFT_456967 [Eremomyces bilateralis CBS 781.70]KAF1813584.1 hypothetical protein P152DRAFT_456967 [Eremomyces bilateralis CBS 781.70]